jgi:hypothetical protein
MLLRDQGETAPASVALAESLSLFTDLGDELWTARVMVSQAKLKEVSGEGAAGLLEEAAEICRRNGITDEGKMSLLLSEW